MVALTEEKCGQIAKAYLLGTAHKVAHFDKNAAYIESIFKLILPRCSAEHQCLCEDNVALFSTTLAAMSFPWRPGTNTDCNAVLDEDTFLKMCYVFVLHVFYHDGVTIGKRLDAKLADLRRHSGCDEDTTRAFVKQLANDLCDLLA